MRPGGRRPGAWHAGDVNALQGNLGPGVLAHLLQYLAMERATGVLSVRGEGRVAAHVYLARGRVVHAAHDGLSGAAALDRMLGWGHGSFAFRVGVAAPVTTIDLPVEALLLSLAVERDGRLDPLAAAAAHGANGSFAATPLVDPGVVPGLVWAAVEVAGPIGEIFVDEAFDAIGHHPRLFPEEQIGALLQQVARRFRSAQGREDFLTRAEAVLAHHGYGRVEEGA